MKKSLIVTGASRGIGAATAILSAREGWQVCVNYRSHAEEAEETLRGVRKAGGTGIAVQADVGDGMRTASGPPGLLPGISTRVWVRWVSCCTARFPRFFQASATLGVNPSLPARRTKALSKVII